MSQETSEVLILRQCRYLSSAAFCLFLIMASMMSARGESAASKSAASPGETDEASPVIPDSKNDALLFPTGDLYPQYIADPHRVGFGILLMQFSETEIADSGDSRFGLKAGGRFGIVRVQPKGQSNIGWQLSVEGGFDAQFDIDRNLDNIGWDGNYGLMLTTAQSPAWAFKFGLFHTSSHVGDEYEERTGRRRIGYTRHELAAGVSRSFDERWRAYAEIGRGYDLKNDILQKPGRLQFGLEFENPASLWNGRAGWYAAMDASSMEERDWRIDASIQAGFVIHSIGRTWRFGVEHYGGRPPIGEFFQDTERYTALGLWIEV